MSSGLKETLKNMKKTNAAVWVTKPAIRTACVIKNWNAKLNGKPETASFFVGNKNEKPDTLNRFAKAYINDCRFYKEKHMVRQSEADKFTQQAFPCLQHCLISNGIPASSQIIFEMNFLPGRVNQRCADKCGGLKNARYLNTEQSVDWSWQRKAGILSEENNKYKGFNRC